MTPIKLPQAPPLVAVKVNGQEMQLPKGKNLLQALLDAGHYIPHYCYHPALSVAGNCRLCLVEIEGRPKPEVSCNMVVSDGLSILTNSPLVESCRKGMMEFLLVNHPLDCPICDRGGECMLQRYSMEYGTGTARTVDARRRFEKPDFDPLIDIERNRCIMCTRCVRFTEEVGGDHVMGVFGHGNRNYIGTYGNGPVSNPFSGNVIDLCPVGCLTSKPFRFSARVWELRQTLTTTRTCNGAVTAWTRGGKLMRVTPPVRRRVNSYTIDEDTTRFISNEQRFGSMHANNAQRLLEPTLGQGSGAKTVKWEEALAAAVQALQGAGTDQMAFLAGERSTNEEFALLAKLARGVCGTANLDWRARFVSDEGAAAAGLALAASDGDLDLLDKRAYGATVVVGAGDLLDAAPDVALRIKEAARLGRTKLGLVDTRIEKWFGRHSDTIYLEAPAQMAGVMDQLAQALAQGKDAANAPKGYENLFKLFTQEQGLLVVGLDGAGGALAATLVPAALRLLKALGEGWQFLPVTAARNAKGAFACGAQADRLLTGEAGDAAAAQSSAALLGMKSINAQAGPAAPEILRRAAQGEYKVLFLHRCDELVNHPERELIEKALRATPMVIAVDVFPSWVTELASVVLPGSMFFETDGSMTDIDGTLQRMSQGAKPAGGAQEEWRILDSLCVLLSAQKSYRRASEIFADLIKAWGAPDFMKLDDLLLEGPGDQTPQRHHTYTKRSRPAFKLSYAQRPETKGKTLAAGGQGLALLWTLHSQGADQLGSRSEQFEALRQRAALELTPADAGKLGVAEGDWVALVGGSGAACAVKINPHLAAGVAYGAANVLDLRLKGQACALPVVEFVKTSAPQGAQSAREVEASK